MKRVFILKGLDCPNCSAKIEKEVGALPGVESSVVNLMQQTLTVQSEKSADAEHRDCSWHQERVPCSGRTRHGRYVGSRVR